MTQEQRSDVAGRLTAAGRTHVGHVRSGNEDAHLVRPDAGLFVVADGMGGHAAGEVASALAVEAVEERLAGDGPAVPDGARRAVEESVGAANRRILREARRDPSRRGMGTTATVLLLPGPGRWLAGHVGDSRAYLLRGGELTRLTTDHTVAPGSSTLTRALGTREELPVDVLEGEAEEGDVFLLCSDGLTDMLPDDEIRDTLAGALAGGGAEGRDGGVGQPGDGRPGEGELRRRLEGGAAALVEAALERGGRDNVTVVVVAVG